MNITLKMLSKNETPCVDGLAWFEKQDKKDVVSLVKMAIKTGEEEMKYCAWGLNAVMTKKQSTEWSIFCAYQVAYLWKDKYPKEYAIWDRWASGVDRSTAAWEAAKEAAKEAAWAALAAKEAALAALAAGEAAYNKMFAKLLRYGVKILMEKRK